MSRSSERVAEGSEAGYTEDDEVEKLELEALMSDNKSSCQSQIGSKIADSAIEKNEEIPDGTLSEELIDRFECLSNLNRTADGSSYAYLEMSISNLRLENIEILAEFNQLQVLNVSQNRLSSLHVLGCLENLIELDASGNDLSEAFDFSQPLRNLRRVDLSHNRISSVPDLRDYCRLQKLNLSHNDLAQLSPGLQQCLSLRQLNLGHNQLQELHNLSGIGIESLNAECNLLQDASSFSGLHRLQRIFLAGNRIQSLLGMEDHPLLQLIDLRDNSVLEILELRYLKSLELLRDLCLINNPIENTPDYRLLVIFNLPFITQLDDRRVDIKEKVQAENQENPSMEIVAQRDHRLNMVYSYFQPHTVLDSTLQSAETPYPMLVLVGPNGSMKKDLAQKLVNDFPEYFGYGLSTTTRAPFVDEEPGRYYSHVSFQEFEELQVNGRFIQTVLFQGNYYGITVDAVEAVAREGLACVVHMELEGVLALKKTHFEPRYVLTMPLDQFRHDRHLRVRQPRKELQIRESLGRADLYLQYNQEHPGFFDMFIGTDDETDAYRQLKMLVMNYLGLATEDKDNADDFASSGRTLQRTWSKTSQHSSVFNPVRPSAPQTSGNGEVEEQSVRRRHSVARETVSSGKPQGRVANVSGDSSKQTQTQQQQQQEQQEQLNRLALSSSEPRAVHSTNPKAPRSRSRAGLEGLAGATTYSPAALIEA